jgi:pimeloyl-ACP methyl ester carboxylesterase
VVLPPLAGGAVRLLGWSVRPGQTLRRGEPLCLVEQAGRVCDIPSLHAGVVRRFLARPRAEIVAGQPLAEIITAPPSGDSNLPVAGGTLHLRRWAPAGAPRGTCLLLHGFAGSLDGWAGTAAGLVADGFAVVAPDLPAHGASTAAAETPQSIADLLGAAWPALQLAAPVHLVGHSMGGAVALLLAAARPERVASLTLIAPLGFAPRVNGGFVAGVLAARDTASLAEALRPLTARPVPMPPEALAVALAAQTRHAGAQQRLAACVADGDRQRLDLAATLASLPMPARMIVGDADAVLPWNKIVPPPHVPLHRLACGHMPHWELPGVMRRLLAQHDWRPATGESR